MDAYNVKKRLRTRKGNYKKSIESREITRIESGGK